MLLQQPATARRSRLQATADHEATVTVRKEEVAVIAQAMKILLWMISCDVWLGQLAFADCAARVDAARKLITFCACMPVRNHGSK